MTLLIDEHELMDVDVPPFLTEEPYESQEDDCEVRIIGVRQFNGTSRLEMNSQLGFRAPQRPSDLEIMVMVTHDSGQKIGNTIRNESIELYWFDSYRIRGLHIENAMAEFHRGDEHTIGIKPDQQMHYDTDEHSFVPDKAYWFPYQRREDFPTVVMNREDFDERCLMPVVNTNRAMKKRRKESKRVSKKEYNEFSTKYWQASNYVYWELRSLFNEEALTGFSPIKKKPIITPFTGKLQEPQDNYDLLESVEQASWLRKIGAYAFGTHNEIRKTLTKKEAKLLFRFEVFPVLTIGLGMTLLAHNPTAALLYTGTVSMMGANGLYRVSKNIGDNEPHYAGMIGTLREYHQIKKKHLTFYLR